MSHSRNTSLEDLKNNLEDWEALVAQLVKSLSLSLVLILGFWD